MKKIPDPGKFSVSPLYKRASVKLMHMELHPVRGVWVEILSSEKFEPQLHVAPREGCVSRNNRCNIVVYSA